MLECRKCHNRLIRFDGLSSEPEGIRQDAYCPECHIRYAVHKSGIVAIQGHNITDIEHEKANEFIRKHSGGFDDPDTLTAFLYLLMRDHLPIGIVEDITRSVEYKNDIQYCNGWLAKYAAFVSDRLIG